MSYANPKTRILWQNFRPRISTIPNRVGNEWYSAEGYDTASYFDLFDPTTSFTKWAAVRVSEFGSVPEGMDTLIIPAGEYAEFHYRGKASEAHRIYQDIYSLWIPASKYRLDDRPHLAIMGEKYRGESDDSEEIIRIPVRLL